MKTKLAEYDNNWYSPGRSPIVRGLWYIVNALFFLSPFFPLIAPKRFLLRCFGAKVGRGVVLKPTINIKYPWLLEIGDHAWIGENVWIDNLAKVSIGANTCLSQGAMLLCGNHNFKSSTFDLIVEEIILEDGVWIGAKAVVGPGTHCCSHAVLAVSSVATGKLDSYTIYRGNPAVEIKKRIIE